MRPVRIAVPAMVAALLLGGCGGTGDRADTGTPGGRSGVTVSASTPAPDPSALVRSVGQGCTWHGGLSVTVPAVRRDDEDAGGAGRAGYSVEVRVINSTQMGYATDALTVRLWVGPADRPAVADFQTGLGTGLAGAVAAAGKTVSGSYGFQLPAADAAGQVAVGIQASPVDQQCLLRGAAQQVATP